MGGLDRGGADPGRLPGPAAQHGADGARHGEVMAASRPNVSCRVAPRAIAVLSSAYLHSPEARSIWKTLSSADAAGTHRQLVPVRVSEVRITEPFTDHPVVDLARMDAAQATAKLLWALDRPVQPPGSGSGRRPRNPGSPARSRRSGTCRPGTPTSPAVRRDRWSCCATSWPGAAWRWWSPRRCTGWAGSARPSSRWSTRTASWPTTTWSGGCRPSGPRRPAGRLADLARKMGLQGR